jgi:hypothetical protein
MEAQWCNDRKRRNFGGASVVYMAAFFLAFIIAFSAFRMTAIERPTVTTAVTIPAAMAAEPVSQITTQADAGNMSRTKAGP